MKVFTPVRVFMPSQCQWMFDWIFSKALPCLLKPSALQQTQIFICDEDSKIYNAFDKFRIRFMPNAIHQLCVYHLIVQKIEDLNKELIGLGKKEVKDQIRTFQRTLLCFTHEGGVESELELEVAISLLMNWIKHWSQSSNNKLSHNAQILDKFWVKSIKGHQDR